jgi:hypothetical protein
MKFKARIWLIFVTATLCKASLAQSFNVNAVGYINIGLKPGLNFVAVQMRTSVSSNAVSVIFSQIQGGVLDGTTVYVFENGGFQTAEYSDLFGGWTGDAVSKTINPGDGVALYLPGAENKVLTIVGEVPQGTVCTDIPHGFSLKANPIPQSSTLQNLGLPSAPGDMVYLYNPITRRFVAITFDSFGSPSSSATVSVGQSFWYYRPGSPTTWCRTFFVNNPG